MEKELVTLLYKLSAQHYLPIMAHHRVTAEALRHMTDRDLTKVCVYESMLPITSTCICVCTLMLAQS